MQQTTNSDLSRHYLPRQLRHLILQEYLSGVKTARQLSEEHGIPMSTIHKMGQRWKAKNSCSFVSTPNPFPIMSRVTRKKPVNCYPRTKPFGGTWKRLYYVWKAMRSWEISSRKIRCRPAKNPQPDSPAPQRKTHRNKPVVSVRVVRLCSSGLIINIYGVIGKESYPISFF